MTYSLTQSPLVDDTPAGIRITTFTAQFMGIDKPGVRFASLVLLPSAGADSIESPEYKTEDEAKIGHKRLVDKYSKWSRSQVESAMRF